MTDDELNELIGPVCQIAGMLTNAEMAKRGNYGGLHNPALDTMILAARAVKEHFGFHVETLEL